MPEQRLFRRQGAFVDPSPSPAAPDLGGAERWRERRGEALALRGLVAAAPVLAALAGLAGLTRVVSRPAGGGVEAAWWAALALFAAATMWCVERLSRRLLPLAALLEVSLAFPGRAPRRLWVGLGAGNPRTVDMRLAGLRRQGLSTDPSRAATQAVVLLASLGARNRRSWVHAERVASYADLVAGEMGVAPEDRDRLRWAALLHDIGIVTVVPAMVSWTRPLEREEWNAVRNHPHHGADLLGPMRPWLGEWAAAVDQHHERWDGYGYPAGLAAEQIALGARIVAVADAFEVLTAPWSYRPSMSAGDARSELSNSAGRQFDPSVVRAFVNLSIGRVGSRAIPFGLRSDSLAKVRRPATMLTGSVALVAMALLAGLVPGRPVPSRTTEVAGTVTSRPTSSTAAPATTATSTASTPIDVQNVPRQVTAEYAAATTQALDRALGDAIRYLVANRGPNAEFYARLAAVYAGAELTRKQSVYAAEASRNLEVFRDDPGDPVTVVEQVLRGDPSCVVLAVQRDFGALLDDPKEAPVRGYLALAPRRARPDGARNPTAWSILFDGATVDGLPPTSPC